MESGERRLEAVYVRLRFWVIFRIGFYRINCIIFQLAKQREECAYAYAVFEQAFYTVINSSLSALEYGLEVLTLCCVRYLLRKFTGAFLRLLEFRRLLCKHIKYLAVLRFKALRLFFFGLHDFLLLRKLGLDLRLALNFSNICTGVSVAGYACFCFALGKLRFQLFDAVICFNRRVLRLFELFNYWRSR